VTSNNALERTVGHGGPRLAAARSSWPAAQGRSMEFARMNILALIFACGVANAWQDIERPNDVNKNKICMIGSSGTYIRETDECIDTQAKCDARGGRWGGDISGRGRSPGCSLPRTPVKSAPIVRNANLSA